MKIKIEIVGEMTLQQIGALFASCPAAQVKTTPETVSESTPEPAPEQVSESAPELTSELAPETEQAPEPEQAPVTKQDLQIKAAELVNAGKRSAVMALLNSYKASNISSLSKELYAEFYDKLNEL